MPRREFTKATKRLALARSGGNCEAVGAWYGLEPGRRCGASLGAGVEFDHIVLDANSKDNSLANCAAVCPKCHRFKTAKLDTPTAAKTLRQQDRNRGIVNAPKLRGSPFPKTNKSARREARASSKLPLPGPSAIARRVRQIGE